MPADARPRHPARRRRAERYGGIAPFAEEIARYEPASSSLVLKGAVAVVVSSSLLEEAHSRDPVEADAIQGITTTAVAPLSHFLAARRRNPVTVEHNLFTGLADAWPRAWACLGAVAQAYGAGGGRTVPRRDFVGDAVLNPELWDFCGDAACRTGDSGSRHTEAQSLRTPIPCKVASPEPRLARQAVKPWQFTLTPVTNGNHTPAGFPHEEAPTGIEVSGWPRPRQP